MRRRRAVGHGRWPYSNRPPGRASDHDGGHALRAHQPGVMDEYFGGPRSGGHRRAGREGNAVRIVLTPAPGRRVLLSPDQKNLNAKTPKTPRVPWVRT